MKWLVEVMPNYDVSPGIDHRNGELCRFLRNYKGMLIESDTDRIAFEQEIEERVRDLNGRYPAEPTVKINWMDNRTVVDDEIAYKTLPAIGQFFDKDIFEHICHIVLYPVVNTYRPKGGEQ